MRSVGFCFFLISFIPAAKSQDFLSWKFQDRYFSVQGGIAKVMYLGELKHDMRLQRGFSQAHAGFEARLLSHWSAKLELAGYGLKGSDQLAADSSYEKQRNLSFTSFNVEGNLQLIYYLRKYHGDYHKRWRTDPYLMAGAGFTRFNPKATLGDSATYALHEYQTEGVDYSRFAAVFPVGLGVKFRLNEFLNLTVEGSYRFTLTDYLDDVSTSYPDSLPSLIANQLSNRKDEIEIINQEAYDQLIPGGPRGNSSNNDAYFFLGVRIEYFLPSDLFRSRFSK